MVYKRAEPSLYGCNPETGEDIEGVSYLRISDIDAEGRIKRNPLPQNAKFENEEQAEKYTLSEGDVVIARSGSIGQAYVYKEQDGRMVYASYLIKFSLDTEQVLTEFIDVYTRTPMYWKQVHSAGKGAVQTNINAGSVKDFDIPVPPLDEQERIVEAVEERLERVERLEKSVENVGRLADEYEDSLLSYLLTGRHLNQEKIPESEEWFGQIPENWEVKKLSEIGSRVRSMTEPESGRIYSIYSFDSVDDGSGYYEVDGKDIGSRKRQLNGGEVMISRLNPRINRVQKVGKKHEYPPIASSEFVAIDIEDNMSREYLYEYLRNPILQERLTNHVTGSTGSRSRVGFDFVMNSKVPVPPKDTQREIVDNIRKVDFDTLEKSYSDVSKLFDEYRDSVLSHAFRGEVDY